MRRLRMARLLMACVVGLVLMLGGMAGNAAAEPGEEEPSLLLQDSMSVIKKVYNDTKGLLYDTIQAAIDDAEEGDTILVGPGEYDVTYEVGSIKHYLKVNKSVTIRAADMDNKPVLRAEYVGTSGGGQQQTVFITADGVVLDGLVIYSITDYPSTFTKAVEICNADNVTIKNCSIYDEGRTAIYIGGPEVGKYTITDNLLDGAIVVANGAGDAMKSDDLAVISGNSIWASISFTGQMDSGWDHYSMTKYPTIQNNVIYGTSYGMVINSRDFNATLLIADEILGSIKCANTFPGGTPQIVVDSYEPYKATVHRKRLMLNPPAHNVTKTTYHMTIQDAIDSASSGDTIEVAQGEYEGNIIIDEPDITLESAVKHAAVIEGRIIISANDVTVNGFTIERQEPTGPLVKVGPYTGVEILSNVIDGAKVDGSGLNVAGIQIGSSGVTIDNNTIIDNKGNGIWVNANTAGRSINVTRNTIESNRTGINFDSHVEGVDVSVTWNTFKDNTENGISIGSGNAAIHIADNTFEGNLNSHISDYRENDPNELPEVEDLVEGNVFPSDWVQIWDGSKNRWLLADRPGIYNPAKYKRYGSIKEAVQDADEGEVVELKGTHLVTESIPISKDLTIEAVEDGVVVDTTGIPTSSPYPFPLGNDVSLSVIGVRFRGKDNQVGFRASSQTYVDSLVFDGCEFTGYNFPLYLSEREPQQAGPEDNLVGTIVVKDCVFDNKERPYFGRGVVESALIQGNSFARSQIGVEFFDYKPERSEGRIEIVGNTFHNEYPIVLLTGGEVVLRDNNVVADLEPGLEVKFARIKDQAKEREKAMISDNMINGVLVPTWDERVIPWGDRDPLNQVEIYHLVEQSSYVFAYQLPSRIVEDRQYTVNVTIEPETVGDIGYDAVRVNVEVTEKPQGSTVTLKATDTAGVEHDIAATGYWGPENGFPIGADYSATTPVKATFSAPGAYTIVLTLVDLSGDDVQELATAEINVSVARQVITEPDPEPSGPPSGPVEPPVIAPSVTETVEAEVGGTVELEDGSAAVELPPNAVSEDVTVTLAPVTEVTQPTAGMVMIAGKVFEITAETEDGELVTQFSEPITLTFKLTQEELEEAEIELEDLRVFYWDEKAGAWIALPTRVDPETGTVTAVTDHFTVFAVMAKPDMPALSDILGHWGEKDILRLVSLGAVGGYEDGTFRPEAGITRQEFAKMVVLAAGLEPDAEPELAFADTDEIAEWARGYVSAAVKAGIITGVGDNRFAPADPVTRAQAATMIMRSLGEVETSLELTFEDSESIPEWAKAAILGAVEKGIITGFEDNTFKPDLSATRAQAAKMLSKLTVVRFED